MKPYLIYLLIAAAPLVAVEACKHDTTDAPAADNTAQNKRDKDVVPNADHAAQSGDDLKITQAVRKAIEKDDTLSTNAHNCKIVVAGGEVTLVGPVKSSDESARVAQIASGVPGATRVINQLSITN